METNPQKNKMETILHLLKSEPDELVADLIKTLSGKDGVAVVSLYADAISPAPIDWSRLVDDIFSYKQVICW
jgi:hypothetical protein